MAEGNQIVGTLKDLVKGMRENTNETGLKR